LFLERMMTTLVLFLSDLLLVRLTRPGRRELRAAMKTALVVSAGDFIVEGIAGRLGLWEYDLPGSIAGLPVDLSPDIGLMSFAYCTGLAYVDRKPSSRRFRPAYVIGAMLAVGTEGWLKNARAAGQGQLAFAIDPEARPVLFAFCNYAVLSLFLLAVTAVFTMLVKRSREGREQ
jgi:hypothetical protein